MTTQEIMAQLEEWGSEQTKKVFVKHGAKEPFFGVKVADLKKIQKKVKKDYKLALELYETGNSDAMYLAGLIADETKMTKEDLQKWVKGAYWYMISEYTVPWVAAESNYGYELALEWIESDDEMTATAGWATLSSLMAVKKDEDLDIKGIDKLIARVSKEIHKAKNRVRYTMNGFVIAAGSYVESLNDKAKKAAVKIGKVKVDMGGTACKTPLAEEYIKKVEARGNIGKKRKTSRC